MKKALVLIPIIYFLLPSTASLFYMLPCTRKPYVSQQYLFPDIGLDGTDSNFFCFFHSFAHKVWYLSRTLQPIYLRFSRNVCFSYNGTSNTAMSVSVRRCTDRLYSEICDKIYGYLQAATGQFCTNLSLRCHSTPVLQLLIRFPPTTSRTS